MVSIQHVIETADVRLDLGVCACEIIKSVLLRLSKRNLIADFMKAPPFGTNPVKSYAF